MCCVCKYGWVGGMLVVVLSAFTHYFLIFEVRLNIISFEKGKEHVFYVLCVYSYKHGALVKYKLKVMVL